jgi:hypothetical protein
VLSVSAQHRLCGLHPWDPTRSDRHRGRLAPDGHFPLASAIQFEAAWALVNLVLLRWFRTPGAKSELHFRGNPLCATRRANLRTNTATVANLWRSVAPVSFVRAKCAARLPSRRNGAAPRDFGPVHHPLRPDCRWSDGAAAAGHLRGVAHSAAPHWVSSRPLHRCPLTPSSTAGGVIQSCLAPGTTAWARSRCRRYGKLCPRRLGTRQTSAGRAWRRGARTLAVRCACATSAAPCPAPFKARSRSSPGA